MSSKSIILLSNSLLTLSISSSAGTLNSKTISYRWPVLRRAYEVFMAQFKAKLPSIISDEVISNNILVQLGLNSTNGTNTTVHTEAQCLTIRSKSTHASHKIFLRNWFDYTKSTQTIEKGQTFFKSGSQSSSLGTGSLTDRLFCECGRYKKTPISRIALIDFILN